MSKDSNEVNFVTRITKHRNRREGNSVYFPVNSASLLKTDVSFNVRICTLF